MISHTCPNCGRVLAIPEKYAGQRGNCNHCGRPIVVPAEPAQETSSADELQRRLQQYQAPEKSKWDADEPLPPAEDGFFTLSPEEQVRIIDGFTKQGIAKRAEGDFDGAIEEFNKAIGFSARGANPRYVQRLAMMLRGATHGDAGRYKAAIKDLTEAITGGLVWEHEARARLWRAICCGLDHNRNGYLKDLHAIVDKGKPAAYLSREVAIWQEAADELAEFEE